MSLDTRQIDCGDRTLHRPQIAHLLHCNMSCSLSSHLSTNQPPERNNISLYAATNTHPTINHDHQMVVKQQVMFCFKTRLWYNDCCWKID